MKRKTIIATLICTVLILASGTIAYAEGAEELITDAIDTISSGEEENEITASETGTEPEQTPGTEENQVVVEYTDENGNTVSQEVYYAEEEETADAQDNTVCAGETTAYYGSGYDDGLADQLFNETNAYRQEHGVSTLARMEDATYADTRSMEITYQWSHERPGGQASLSDGENLAMTGMVTDPHSVIYDMWSNSQFHKENMLDAGYTSMAVSVYIDSTGAAYYVQCFYY